MAKVEKEKPGLLIGLPMCRDWSQIMNINWPRMSQEERDARMKEAREHLRFVCTLYRLQHDEGRYFAHEHPQSAGSWNEDVIELTKDYTDAAILTIDQCQYGLTSTTPEGETLPAFKPTKIMTNCPGMRTTLNKRCDRKSHRHARLEGGKRTSAAQEYPDELCMAIIDGYVLQKKWDNEGLALIASVEVDTDDEDTTAEGAGRHSARPNRHDDDPTRQTAERHRAQPNRTSTTTSQTWANPSCLLEKLPAMSRDTALAIAAAVQTTLEGIFAIEIGSVGEIPPEEIEQVIMLMEAWDDINGKRFDPLKVEGARAEEIGYYYKMKMYGKVPIAECIARTGRQPIGVRWIDHNKGDDLHEKYRSRLVAQQFNSGPMEDNTFAATPPLEALRMVISNATTGKKAR